MERHPGNQEQRNTTQSYDTINVTQEIYWEKTRRVAPSIWVRNSKLNRIQNLYRVSWEGGGTFQGRAFQGGDWWDFMSRNWAFYSVGWGQGPSVR